MSSTNYDCRVVIYYRRDCPALIVHNLVPDIVRNKISDFRRERSRGIHSKAKLALPAQKIKFKIGKFLNRISLTWQLNFVPLK